MPLITVLVAAYNSAMLAQTLDSVSAQTFDDFDVLILDDAGSEECKSLVSGYSDPRFTYVGNPVNLGPAFNHASGIRRARGEYIAILNHDDIWDKEFLERLVFALSTRPDAVAAFTRARVVNVDGVYDPVRTRAAWKMWDCETTPSGVIADWFQLPTSRLGFPIVSTSIFRTDIAQRVTIPRTVGGAYDYWLSYRISRLGPVVHVPEAVGYWREHPGNLSHRRSARKVLETVYINTVASTDRRLPLSVRIAAFKGLPRGLGSMMKEAIRGARRNAV